MARSKKSDGRKVRPIGNPLTRTPADLDREAEVTEEDKLSALALWEHYVGRRRELLRATRRQTGRR